MKGLKCVKNVKTLLTVTNYESSQHLLVQNLNYKNISRNFTDTSYYHLSKKVEKLLKKIIKKRTYTLNIINIKSILLFLLCLSLITIECFGWDWSWYKKLYSKLIPRFKIYTIINGGKN